MPRKRRSPQWIGTGLAGSSLLVGVEAGLRFLPMTAPETSEDLPLHGPWLCEVEPFDHEAYRDCGDPGGCFQGFTGVGPAPEESALTNLP